MNAEQENTVDTAVDELTAGPRAAMQNSAGSAPWTEPLRLGHKAVLTGLGLASLGLEACNKLFARSVERGEMMQADTQKTVSGLQRRAAEGTTAAVSSGTAALLNHVPAISLVYKGPAAAQSPVVGPDVESAGAEGVGAESAGVEDAGAERAGVDNAGAE